MKANLQAIQDELEELERSRTLSDKRFGSAKLATLIGLLLLPVYGLGLLLLVPALLSLFTNAAKRKAYHSKVDELKARRRELLTR